jgi:hypothetical protein
VCGAGAALGIVVACCVVAGVATPAGASNRSGGVGVRLVATTTGPAVGPLGLAFIVETLPPGQRVTRQIEVDNSSADELSVAVFAAAASVVQGKFSFGPDRTGNDLTTWTSVGTPHLHLAAGAKVMERVTITVPKGAPAGERYGVVWAEVSTPSPTLGGVRLVNRVGVRMYVSISPGGVAPARFSLGALVGSRAANNDPVVSSRIRNNGGGALDITGHLLLSNGPGGLSAGPFAVEMGSMLAPHHSTTEKIELNGQIPAGPWRAQLVMSSQGVERSSLGTITFPKGHFTIARHASALPLAVLLGGAVLLAGLGSILVRRRRRSRVL